MTMNKQLQKLTAQLSEIAQHLPAYACVNNKVSQVSAGWHLSHCMLTLRKIIETIGASDPAGYKRRFSFSKLLVFTSNSIPRGKGRAPKTVLPTDINEGALQNQLQELSRQVALLDGLDPNQYFAHPYFGDLKLKEAIRFMEIHTRHHLKIVREILA